MIKKIIHILTVVLVVFGMLATATPALAKNDTGKVAGVIAAIDTTASIITITPKSGADVVSTMDSGTIIRRNTRLVTLADLQVGDKVDARYDPATLIASKVFAWFKARNVMGTIAAVDTTASTVTIKRKFGRTEVIVNVNSSTWIKRNGHKAALADLTVGDIVDAWYDPATMIASKVFAMINQVHLVGTISAVDTTASTVTVTRTPGRKTVTLVVDAKTKIKQNNLPAILADLQVGDKITAQYNPVTKLAYRIYATNASLAALAGVIKAVDTTANTVTIKPMRGAEVALKVDASTVIMRNGLPATLADLLVGDHVAVKYNQATMLAYRIEAKGGLASEVAGVIKAVDTTASTVTIKPAHEDTDVVLTVDADTVIMRNNIAATLADLKSGDMVVAKYDPATMVALRIHAVSFLVPVEGTIDAVDTAASTVTVKTKFGGMTVVLNIDASTEIKRNDTAATLANLKVGDQVKAKFNPATMLAFLIEAEG